MLYACRVLVREYVDACDGERGVELCPLGALREDQASGMSLDVECDVHMRCRAFVPLGCGLSLRFVTPLRRVLARAQHIADVAEAARSQVLDVFHTRSCAACVTTRWCPEMVRFAEQKSPTAYGWETNRSKSLVRVRLCTDSPRKKVCGSWDV